jgi:ATP-binding cassette, subfamily B (MDR/TAP), member 1
MLSTDATAMSSFSGTNLGAFLTLLVDLTSVIIVGYSLFVTTLNCRVAFAWKLGLVAVSLLPVQVFFGFKRFQLQKTLSDGLRKSYANSADIACEQVAAIRTVASLNREARVLESFIQSLEKPVHDALIRTLKSTGV